jgi:phosphate transport system permease protein
MENLLSGKDALVKIKGGGVKPATLFAEKAFKKTIFIFSLIVSVLILVMVASLFVFSYPSIVANGFKLLTGTEWTPSNNEFGAVPFIVGTLFTSILALAISLPFSLAIAIFLGEYFKSGPLSTIVSSAIELLAGIPSVIFGAWGLYVLVPLIQKIELGLSGFGVIPMGISILAASVLLAIMIIPYSASIAREVISLTPQDLKEGASSLGATRFEVIWRVMLPFSRSGIFAGMLLAFGRALGETMAVTMVIGNLNIIPGSIFSGGNTIASVIANEYAESSGIHKAALTEIGLLLFVLTILFGFAGRWVINKMSIKD